MEKYGLRVITVAPEQFTGVSENDLMKIWTDRDGEAILVPAYAARLLQRNLLIMIEFDLEYDEKFPDAKCRKAKQIYQFGIGVPVC